MRYIYKKSKKIFEKVYIDKYENLWYSNDIREMRTDIAFVVYRGRTVRLVLRFAIELFYKKEGNQLL